MYFLYKKHTTINFRKSLFNDAIGEYIVKTQQGSFIRKREF